MPPKELHLIGTLHIDLKGPHRLAKLLRHISPEAVAVEIDEKRAEAIRKYGNKRSSDDFHILRKNYPNANLDTLRELASLAGYELLISENYITNRRGAVVRADTELDLGILTEGAKEFTHVFDLSLPPEKFPSSVDRVYDYFSDKGTSLFLPDLLRESFEERDAHTEKVIRSLEGKVVYIGGIAHIYGAYSNLYERLKDLNPVRHRLIEADSIPEPLTW